MFGLVVVGLLWAGGQVGATLKAQSLAPGITVSCPVVLKPLTEAIQDPGMSSIAGLKAVLDDCVFLATIGNLKDSKTETSELFTATLMGFTDSEGGGKDVKILGLRDVLLRGWPGYAVTLKSTKGVNMAVRAFREKDRLVELICVYPSDSRPPASDAYLDSLHFDTDGPQKKVGPDLERYPLGDSGLTALFTRKPETHSSPIGKGDTTSKMYTFASDYVGRSFEVAYSDMSPKAPDDLASQKSLMQFVTEDSLRSLHGKKGKRMEITVGSDPGLRTEFSLGDQFTGVLVAYMHERRMVMLLEFAPTCYQDSATVEAFLSSVQAKP